MTDSTLIRSLKSLFIALLVLPALVAMLLLASWLWPLSKAQRAALAALQPTGQETPGSNAYTAIATLGLDGLTEPQRQAKVDDYIARFDRWQAAYTARHIEQRAAPHPSDDEAPTLLAEDEQTIPIDKHLCTLKEGADCLDKVRAQPQAVAAALDARAGLLERIGRLSAHGHFREPLAKGMGTSPNPPSMGRILATPLAAHAQAYLRGDPQRAMAGLCRDAASARMLMTHSDYMFPAVVGGAWLNANAEELAAMLSELPPDTSLPATCNTALAPPTAFEMSACTAMRGEFLRVSAQFRSNRDAFRKQRANLFFDENKSKARAAENMGWLCLPESIDAIAKDHPVPAPPHVSMFRLECATNYVGCVLSSVAGLDSSAYARRLQDVGAKLRLLQAILWLRENATELAGQPLPKRLQALPASLRQGPRTITVSADGRALQLPSYSAQAKGTPLSMPLPQALLASNTL